MRADEAAGPTVPELRQAMLAYCDTARTKAEILEHARCDRDIASRIMEQLVGQGKIMIAPGTASTSAMRWVVSAKAKAALKAMDGGQDDRPRLLHPVRQALDLPPSRSRDVRWSQAIAGDQGACQQAHPRPPHGGDRQVRRLQGQPRLQARDRYPEMAAGVGGGQMMQMSLTGEIPLTRDNVLRIVRERGPIMETDLLKALGHEVTIDQLNILHEVVRELREEKAVTLSVFIDDDHVVHHKLHVGTHPDARCPVRGVGQEDNRWSSSILRRILPP